MTSINASRARIPTRVFNEVVFRNERVEVRHRSGASVYLVSKEDIELLEAIEDYVDLLEVKKAIQELEEGKEVLIPWEEVKQRLGL